MLGFRDYLEYAGKYIKRAELEQSKNIDWLLIPSIILSWTAIEAFVNSRTKELMTLPEDALDLHEKAFLLEKRIRFGSAGNYFGQFTLEGMERHTIEEKIIFLLAKFGMVHNWVTLFGQLPFNNLKSVTRFHRKNEPSPKFGAKNGQAIKDSDLWRDFQEFKLIRDTLVHPKREKRIKLNIVDTKKFIQVSKDVIQLLSENIWHKKIIF